jgi:hypothetical protein
MRLHLVGLPHTQTTREVSVCAFTQKIIKFCKMMKPLGYEIVLYAGDENDAECDELVSIVTREEQREWYGPVDLNAIPSQATQGGVGSPWEIFNERTIAEISERVEPDDQILITAGTAQQASYLAFPDHTVVEWAAGYENVFAKYACFESYSWMHHVYGKHLSYNHGRWYDAVIPNFFDLSEWDLPDNNEPGGYLLYLGRMIQNKGIWVAAQIADKANKHLVMAGPGVTNYGDGWVEADGLRMEGNLSYIGTVGGRARSDLIRKAAALLAPTLYIEPFGGVAVEAQLCGTPAITTDWGAFPETVTNGLNGYRFRTLKEGVEAVEKSADLDAMTIANHARAKYQLATIGPQYDSWFQRLDGLRNKGWMGD